MCQKKMRICLLKIVNFISENATNKVSDTPANNFLFILLFYGLYLKNRSKFWIFDLLATAELVPTDNHGKTHISHIAGQLQTYTNALGLRFSHTNTHQNLTLNAQKKSLP